MLFKLKSRHCYGITMRVPQRFSKVGFRVQRGTHILLRLLHYYTVIANVIINGKKSKNDISHLLPVIANIAQRIHTSVTSVLT